MSPPCTLCLCLKLLSSKKDISLGRLSIAITNVITVHVGYQYRNAYSCTASYKAFMTSTKNSRTLKAQKGWEQSKRLMIHHLTEIFALHSFVAPWLPLCKLSKTNWIHEYQNKTKTFVFNVHEVINNTLSLNVVTIRVSLSICCVCIRVTCTLQIRSVISILCAVYSYYRSL